MNNERILSLEADSMIYHKPGCRYVKRINKSNRMSLPKVDAKKHGYHVCRYCNSMNHHYRAEQTCIEYYERCKKFKFKFNFIDGILYVKTDIGCWKLVYVRKEEKFVLYHRNTVAKELDFENPQFEPYHRQADKPFSATLAGYLDYIYEHDKYKAAIERGETVTRFSNKRYAANEARAQKKRQDRRVDYLFRVLERENNGFRELSYC